MARSRQATSTENEGWYGSIFEHNPSGLCVLTSEGAVVEYNRAFIDALGLASSADVETLNVTDLFSIAGGWSSFFEKVRTKVNVLNEEWCTCHKSGSQMWFLANVRFIKQGRNELAILTVVDITERKSEDDETQKHLRLTSAVADLGQQSLQSHLGFNLPELVVSQVAAALEVDYCQILAPDKLAGSVQHLAGAVWAGGQTSPMRLYWPKSNWPATATSDIAIPDPSGNRTPDESHFLMEEGFASVMSVTIGSDMRPWGFLSVHSKKVRYFDDQEISFLQSVANVLAASLSLDQADGELRTSEERLRLAMDAASLGIWDCDLTTKRINWTQSQAVLFGFPPDKLTGTFDEFRSVLHLDDRADFERALEHARLERRSYSHECRLRRSDGEHWIAVQGRFFYDEAGHAYRVMGVTMDISERRRIEEQSRLRDRALEAVSQGIVITDRELPDNPIIYTNQGFERLTGYSKSESIGRNCRFLQGPLTDRTIVQELRQAIEKEEAHYCELLNYRKDGSSFWNALALSPVPNKLGKVRYFLGVSFDVSERRRLEDQYSHAQKMEAVGRFAGGVAHDFNNLLTVINGYSDMLLEMLPAGEQPHSLIGQIRHAGERGANLTRQILAFSKHQGAMPRILDMNEVIVDMESMLCRLIGEDLEFKTSLDANLKPVKLDPAQLDQVIVNLVINARDAMPKGGLLSISTRSVEMSANDVCGHLDAKPGCYAMLSISDTGMGMDEATRARIFEPFFTTKGSRGTGLGLATVHRIVHQAGGFIEVLSVPGDGASFQVYLPGLNEVPNGAVKHLPEPRGFRGNETVLLVEDEEGVRKLVSHTLERVGFKVLQAPNGPEALEVSRSYHGPIHLLVSDVVMPRMSGSELASQLVKLRPQLKVLFMSGYVDEALVRHGVLHDEAAFLQKPFDAAALTAKVTEALNRT
jgi:PAS domain S-box-containing protein